MFQPGTLAGIQGELHLFEFVFMNIYEYDTSYIHLFAYVK